MAAAPKWSTPNLFGPTDESYGLHLACNLRFAGLIIESNSLSVVSVINKGSYDSSHLGTVIQDIGPHLATSFQSVEFSFIPSQANNLAHVFAKFASSNSVDGTKVDNEFSIFRSPKSRPLLVTGFNLRKLASANIEGMT
ncbi:hypothetical protein GH714_006606 [Hevea brasiliensis]|uniref:RNase H type-1 domain-containing protein n=1 Tax=Hevea brasiliensis TaxID=3981 RepID=A0A6A6M8Q1_HEVBR|nr:hypothetical protein GH714_006606 [Hevea brasiliensis]